MTTKIQIAHTPSDLPIYISCFRDVSNANFLKSQLLAANQEFNYAFIDASTITSRRHLLSAIFRALNDHVHDRLKSNNVHSEIVFCLSPNNNIGDAFRRFGVQDTTRELVVVKVGGTTTTPTPTSSTTTSSTSRNGEISRDSVQAHLQGAVKGRLVPFDDDDFFVQVCDLDKVRKTYKLGGKSNRNLKKMVNGDAGNTALNEQEEIEVQVLGLMALRGAT